VGRHTSIRSIAVVDAGDVHRGGEPEFCGDLLEFGGGAAEDHDVIDVGVGVVDACVGEAEAGAQQTDLHGSGRFVACRAQLSAVNIAGASAFPLSIASLTPAR
jgi:hypothetical protein